MDQLLVEEKKFILESEDLKRRLAINSLTVEEVAELSGNEAKLEAELISLN